MTEPLPAFVGVGALKAGTTYLDELLRGHPQLSLPLHLKEVEYFTRHHARGAEWYAGQFAPPDGRLRGEISPQYMSDAQALDRVHAANPAVRILVSLRDPVDRTISQYRHWVQETGYRGDVGDFLGEHPNAVDRSRYATMLAPWLERFGRESVHVVIFEELVADPVPTVASVFRFLGVADDHSPDVHGATNASVAPRFPRAYATAKRLSRRLYAGDHARIVGALKRSPLGAALKSGSPTDVRDVAEPVRADLAETFRPDVEWVAQLLDRDLGAFWRR